MPKMNYICGMRIFLFWTFFSINFFIYAQLIPGQEGNDFNKNPNGPKLQMGNNDSLDLKIYQPTIKDYTYWKNQETKLPFDTTLTLHNQYRYTQFNNKDNFHKTPFNNIGQPFNTIIMDSEPSDFFLLPSGKKQNYIPSDSIRYYDVKTPTTEFIFHNGMREGQALSTLFTHSINKNINYGIEYKGLRSLGHYLESEVDNRTFIFTINARSKNQKYSLWGHYYNLNSGAVENAGIQNRQDFTSNDSNYRNRQRLLTNLSGARSKYLNKRYYLGQSFNFLKVNDSITSNQLKLSNEFSYQTNSFRYYEESSNTFYLNLANYIENTPLEVNKYNKIFANYASIAFDAKDKWRIQAGVNYQNIRYFFNEPTVVEYVNFEPQLEDNRIGFKGNIEGAFSDTFILQGNVEFMTGSTFNSTYHIEGEGTLNLNTQFSLTAGLSNLQKPPNLNLLMNNSFYDHFNYYISDFKNENHTELRAELSYHKWKTHFGVKAFSIENLTYLNYDGQALQLEDATQIIQFNLRNHLNYNKFHVDTELIFQNVNTNATELPLPNFDGRMNIYYKSLMFRNAANVQIGLKARYFTQFKSREYFPIINEFKLQEAGQEIKIGGYPILDFYYNMRVKTMQIYLEAQHFNALFGKRNYFATPNIPMFDFRLNIGLVWYLFT